MSSVKEGGTLAKAGMKQALLKKADNALQKRNYDLAIYSYQQILADEPGDHDVRLKLRATQTRNVKDNGTKKFKALIATVKANVFKALKKYDEAIAACEQGITADPNNLKLLLLFCDLCVLAGKTDIAIWQRQSLADTIAAEDVENLFVLVDLYSEAGQIPAAISCLEKIHEIDPEQDVDQQTRELSAQLSSQIFSKAAVEGSRAIQKDAEESDKLELDPSRLRNDEQRRKAINYRKEQDLKERPKDHAIWLTIGDIAANLDDFTAGYDEAKGYYNSALELSPANSAIRDRIGDLEMKRNRLQMQILSQKAKSGDEEAKAKLQALRKSDLAFQLAEFERRVKDQPMKADFHNKLGLIYMQYKRFDEAIGELQQAGKDPRFKIPALTNIGRCMIEQNNPQMAINQFKRARDGVELFEKYREPMYYEAVAYQALGDKESLLKAQELFTKLYEVDIKFRDVKDRVEALSAQLSA